MAALPLNPTTDDAEKTAVAKIIGRLLPFLALLYAFNIIDRTNVGYAGLQMRGDLNMSQNTFNTGFGIFFIGYFLVEVPSNIIMERVGARRWIARIMITWGAVSASMMFVHSTASFYSLRFLLGVAEAGFFPGILLYLTYWVPSKYRATLLSRFLALQAFIGLIGNPIGAVLIRLHGRGLHGWQWLFLLEGIPSILLGFTVIWFLPDRPKDAKWLTAEEKEWVEKATQVEAAKIEKMQHFGFRQALTEPRILLLCAIFFITACGGNAIGNNAPQMLKQWSHGSWPDSFMWSHGKWSDSFIVLIMIIPSALGLTAMLIAASHSDRTDHRRRHVMAGYFAAGCAFFVCIAAPSAWWVIALLACNSIGERVAAGSYWAVTSNLLGIRAAAAGLAFINSVGNLGGFVGPKLMGKLLEASNSNYRAGLAMAGSMFVVGAALSFFMRKPSANPQE